MRWVTPTLLAVAVAIGAWLAGSATALAEGAPPNAGQPDPGARPRLIRSMEAVYLVDRGKRRWIISPQVFTDYRFREDWIERIPDDDLNRIGLGPDLVAGPVLRGPDGSTWIVYGGTRREAVGVDAYAPLYLREEDAVPATAARLAEYPAGRPAGNRSRSWPLWASFALVFSGALACVVRAPAASGRPGTRRFLQSWGDVILIATASTILKAWYVSLWPWIPDGADAVAYVGAARFLAAGNSILTEDKNGTLVSVTSSAYPIILALTSPATWLTNGNVVGWKGLQVLVAALIPAAVGAIAHQIAGLRAARVAAVIAAISPAWFYSAELLQYELWLGLAISIATLVTMRRAFAWLHVASIGPELLGGIAWAVAAFTQVKTAVLLGPVVAWTWWWTSERRGHLLPGTTRVAVVATLALAPILLWGIRNVVANDAFVIGSTGSGTLLWIGNQPSATGGYMAPARPSQFYEKQRDVGGPAVTRDARTFAALALDHVSSHPDHAAVLALQKLERFWWTITPDRLGEHLHLRTLAFLGWHVSENQIVFASKLATALGLALAIVGTLGPLRETVPGQAAARLLVVAIVLAFWVAHVPFIAEPRYRIPVLPLIHVLEALGLVFTIDALKAKQPFRLARAGAPGKSGAPPGDMT